MKWIRSRAERLAYRNYRRIKSFYLNHPRAPLGRTFFRLLEGTNKQLSAQKVDRLGQLESSLWKTLYFSKYGDSRPFHLETQSPVAAYSDDTKWPRGAIYDNSTNRDFNLKVYDYFRRKPGLSLLDLGCAGGGLVKSFLADGYTAVQLGFGAIKATRKPLPICKAEVESCYESRLDELGCLNPEFFELPGDEPTFRIFAQVTKDR